MFKTATKFIAATAVVFAFGLGSQQAQAQSSYSCSNNIYNESLGTYSADAYTSGGVYGDPCSANNTGNSASTVVTSTAVLATAASQTARLVGDRVSAAISGSQGGVNFASNEFSASSGLSGGGMNGKAGVWVSGSYSDVEDGNTDTAFDGQVYTVLGGVDYRVSEQAIIGLSVGYEDVDIDTKYNGFGGQDGNLSGTGYTIAPYVGFKLAPNAYANISAGYSDVEYDTLRFDPISGNRITGSTDADRYFVNASVGGDHFFNMRGDDNWHLRGRATVFYATEEKDAFSETESNGTAIAQGSQDTDLGQFMVDARFGYNFNGVEPYALAGVQFDFAKDEAAVAVGQTRSSLDDEDFGAKFGAGLDFNIAPNVSGGFEAYTIEFRDDYEEYTVQGGLRVEF